MDLKFSQYFIVKNFKHTKIGGLQNVDSDIPETHPPPSTIISTCLNLFHIYSFTLKI